MHFGGTSMQVEMGLHFKGLTAVAFELLIPRVTFLTSQGNLAMPWPASQGKTTFPNVVRKTRNTCRDNMFQLLLWGGGCHCPEQMSMLCSIWSSYDQKSNLIQIQLTISFNNGDGTEFAVWKLTQYLKWTTVNNTAGRFHNSCWIYEMSLS